MREIDIYRAFFQFIYGSAIPDTKEGAEYLRGVVDFCGEIAERARNNETSEFTGA